MLLMSYEVRLAPVATYLKDFPCNIILNVFNSSESVEIGSLSAIKLN